MKNKLREEPHEGNGGLSTQTHIDTQSDKEVELMNEDIARNVCTK
ncbi:hypothetical protein [Vibrio kanaloae]|nr:hypothetical protein [Vibrio kanaloae]